MIGVGSMVVIGAAALLIFGPKKLPELGRAAGDTLREFKNSTKGLADDDEDRTEDKKESK
ncbi:twin-arginine translocase TatA/TatE family subunit [Domibacillus indicus]|uniref:twin-arginine translocase TatA/TatE family subunit n=1 Tax=Domibacillus indicus TaxID=1437523 RepID=UPI0006180A1A|nr:twin-arginine translocase TatA/TatE family subunit [Domibacillus indicus]